MLGLLGKTGRGERPLLLSTELAGSTRETENKSLGPKIASLSSKIETEVAKGSGADKSLLKSLRSERMAIRQELLKRNVGVYGAINLRTYGKVAVIAFRKEAGKPTSRWFYYEPEKNAGGRFDVKVKGH